MAGNSGLLLDGNSWKNKEIKTYTSILDLYGVSELFSEDSYKLYQESTEKDKELQGTLKEYILRQQRLLLE